MTNVFNKLANGINNFDCNHKGIPNKCKILKMDLETERAYVRFENAIKKEESISKLRPFANSPDDYYFETIEVDCYEDWISLT